MEGEAPQEPVWLVRAVLVLVLVGLSAWVARQAWLAFHS